MTKVNGQLLGTTATGGYSQCFIDFSCGTVFSVNPATDTENVLYPFCSQQSCTDGKSPVANVIDVGGTLYGTTEAGGAGVGTIFSLDPTTGSETVLYSFLGGADGWGPVASLIDVKGTLYGTTYLGGGTGCGDGGTGCGTVFSFDPSTGVEKILYSFCQMSNCSDGQNPEVSLIYVKGQLYGTTGEGGNAGCGGAGCGTIFSLDLETGAEKVVYSFCSQQNCADGANASSSLIDVNGVLYGTTAYGGNAGCDTSGCGTVFSLDPHTGVETVVYAFCSQQNCSDGSKPVASLINVDGILYGTTETGGTHNQGTVFALTGVH
ncbi:MAG TPA: choice-of-anchor tandem repeat GloVer-containing protein [Rhizomicrobium sp.]|nr:choice-of-anchor tandem repeat GloVer-containing protein [Rhizomicrobium sp.]